MTAAKMAMMEGLSTGYTILNPNAATNYQPEGKDLRPQSIQIEYPNAELDWPALLIQFHPSKVEDIGMNPEFFIAPTGVPATYTSQQLIYFEGAYDLSIYSLTSQERDRLWDGLINMILLQPVSVASQAFYQIINNYDLLPQLTLLQSQITPIGDTIGPGVPWNEELLVYEATIRVPCVGVASNPYSTDIPSITKVILTGTSEADGSTRTIYVPASQQNKHIAALSFENIFNDQSHENRVIFWLLPIKTPMSM